MGVARDVEVKAVHEFPGGLLALHLDPTGNVQEAGARGIGVGHDHVALVDGLGQVGPRRRQRQVVFAGFDRVVADRGDPGPLPDPLGRVVFAVVVLFLDLVQALGRVALEVALVAQQHQAGGGKAPDDIGPGVVLFGQQLGGDDSRGIAHPLDVDVRVVLFELALEHGKLVGLDGGIDQEVYLGQGAAGSEAEHQQGTGDNRRQLFQIILEHELVLHLPS